MTDSSIPVKEDTSGTLRDIAVVQVAGKDYQLEVVADAVDPSRRLTVNADGSINIAGAITGTVTAAVDRKVVSVDSTSLTTVTTGYTAGDQIGTLYSLANMAIATGGGGLITSMRLLNDAAASHLGPVRAWFFSGSVTLAGDNAAWAVSDADMAKCVGDVCFGTPVGATNNQAATIRGANLDYTCDATTLYVGLQTLTAHTFFVANDDLHLTVNAIRYS